MLLKQWAFFCMKLPNFYGAFLAVGVELRLAITGFRVWYRHYVAQMDE